MGQFVKGDVVVLPFPFSDLSANKRRPALVISALKDDDVILCMITSRAAKRNDAIPLAINDFADGGLHRHSYVRPNRLFTADSRIILRSVGKLTDGKLQEIVDAIIEIIES